ncbi:Short-chain dehydrogenase/reductase 3 [Phytophthora ramorum]
MASNARWLFGDGGHEVVQVQVPPGSLGILLDGDDLDRPMLEGFAQVSPTDATQRGAVESSGRVPVGSLLVAVNEYNFMEEDLGFHEVGDVLRDTSHLPRTLTFHVPVLESSNLPLSQQFVPRRGPPPREEEDEEGEEDDDGEEEEDDDEEEEEGENGSSSSAGDSFQEIHMTETVAEVEDVAAASAVHVAEDQTSNSSTSWTLTGSNLDGSLNTPLVSSASSASPEKLRSEEPQQVVIEIQTESSLKQPKPQLPKPMEPPPSLPADLSFGSMALAQARHFDSDDSSDDSSGDESQEDGQTSTRGVSWKPVEAKAYSSSAQSASKESLMSPEQPQELSPQKPHQPSPVPLSMASNVSSGTIAASLMAQTNQFDRDDSVEEEDDAEYVTAVAPPGPLGLNLDGGVLNRAVVMGFAKLRDGSKGALERNGGILPGSVVVRINGEDFSRATLNDVRAKLGELGQQPRTLVFRLPPKAQQEEQQNANSTRPTGMRRAPTLPPFEEDHDKRRKLELALVMRYDKSVLARRECWFCIDAKWMARWVGFAARGGPAPGPITNETLLHHNWRKMLASDTPGRPDTARDGLVLMKDYRVVAPMVWCLFAELHGLGEAPLLARFLMDVHAEALSEGEVNTILEVPRPKATVLANNLRDMCLVRPSKLR